MALSIPMSDNGLVKVNLQFSTSHGRLCGTKWEDRDAIVVCRELGYKSGIAVRLPTTGTTKNVPYDANCRGNETQLSDCPITPWIGNYACSDSHAAVKCKSLMIV